MTGPLRLYAIQSAAAVRTSMADRANFLWQAGGMFVNDVFMLALWALFFAGFRSVGGWRLPDMALLYGLIMTIVGAAGVFLGGYRDLAASLLKGELDALLTQPRGLIFRLLTRESIASGWGDLVGGLIVLAAFADLGWRDLPLLAIGVAVGLAVYVSASVTFAAMAFWAAGARSFARDLTDFTILFSSNPPSIYHGAAKLVAFTLLPAGFVVVTPVGLIRHPSVAAFALSLGAAGLYTGLAAAAFHLGLRRYRRGQSPTLGGT